MIDRSVMIIAVGHDTVENLPFLLGKAGRM
jgi:hypothetical protein